MFLDAFCHAGIYIQKNLELASTEPSSRVAHLQHLWEFQFPSSTFLNKNQCFPGSSPTPRLVNLDLLIQLYLPVVNQSVLHNLRNIYGQQKSTKALGNFKHDFVSICNV